jgi:hypothetical protein
MSREQICFLQWFNTSSKISRNVALKDTHSLTHGAEPFLRCRKLCSYSSTSPHVTEQRNNSFNNFLHNLTKNSVALVRK